MHSPAKYQEVLLVDDDDMDSYIATRVIQSSAFAKTITTKTNVAEALEFIRDRLKTGRLPEFIFLDVNMPGLTGLDFLNEIKELVGKKISGSKIILLTNTVQTEFSETRKALNHPLVSFVIEKPLTAARLSSL